MPQLDKLILLFQFKFFLIIFVIVYLLFFLLVLPKINTALRVRREKLKYIFVNSLFVKSLKISFFFDYKNYFIYVFNIFEASLDKSWFLLKNSIKNISIFFHYSLTSFFK